LTWSSPFGLQVSGQWRFVGGTKVDGNENNPLDAFGYITTDSIDAKIPDVSYFDLTMEYKFKGKYTLRAGCNNLFDRSPPFGDANNTGVYGQGNGNTFPQLYDTLGRNIFVGLTADF
jgi:outer membrane receptor protein involved in Fe transport